MIWPSYFLWLTKLNLDQCSEQSFNDGIQNFLEKHCLSIIHFIEVTLFFAIVVALPCWAPLSNSCPPDLFIFRHLGLGGLDSYNDGGTGLCCCTKDIVYRCAMLFLSRRAHTLSPQYIPYFLFEIWAISWSDILYEGGFTLPEDVLLGNCVVQGLPDYICSQLAEFFGGFCTCSNQGGCLRSNKGLWSDPLIMNAVF